MDVLTGGRFGGFPPLGFDRAPVTVPAPAAVEAVPAAAAAVVAAVLAAAEAASPVAINWRRLREKLPAAGSLAARSCGPKNSAENTMKNQALSRSEVVNRQKAVKQCRGKE